MRKNLEGVVELLCQFSVKNYKSFREEVTLDLQATNITEHEEEIIIDPSDNERFLPLAAIYGPNGGGKTNIISALSSLVTKVMKPICAACDKKECSESMRKGGHSIPFKFSTITINQPTEYELFFRTKQAEYKYNLNIKDELIFYESLYKRNLNGKKIIEVFVREPKNNKEVKLNKTIFKNIDITGITETLPLLSYLGITRKETGIISDIFRWFEGGIAIINYGNPASEIKIPISKSKKVKELTLKMIKEMDIDIENYRIEDENKDSVKVYTKHIINNFEQELNLLEESNGTIKLFGLIPFISDSIILGSVLVVDELDTKLHPKLLEYIVKLYRNPKINTKCAQLIFTSHDLMTMNSELFRRDEIWFTAKNNEQASQLYSLVEFKKENGKPPRKDEKYGKQYLEGRYGADPYLKRMINWEEHYESQAN